MKLKNLFYIIVFIFLTLYGCGRTESTETANAGLKIRLSADSTKVQLYNVPLNIIEELRSDSLGTEQWQDFFAVYEEVSDKEMRDFQPALNGSYTIMDSLVEFMPSENFTSGKPYFARCYIKDIIEQPEEIISARDLSPTDGFLEFRFVVK